MLSTLSTVLDVLTFTVAALGGISLLVGAVGIRWLFPICLTVGGAVAWLLQATLPALPAQVSWVYVSGAPAASMLIGLSAGVAPVWAASHLDPVESLRAK